MNGTNAPALRVRGYETVNALTQTVKPDGGTNKVTGLVLNWEVANANGETDIGGLGQIAVHGTVSATATKVVTQ